MFRFLAVPAIALAAAIPAVADQSDAQDKSRALADEIAKVRAFQRHLNAQEVPARLSAQAVTRPAISAPAVSAVTMHVVADGDTLFSLAQEHNTTVGELQTLNAINGANIRLGQVLRIPTKIAMRVEPAPAPEAGGAANTSEGRVLQAIATEVVERPYAVLPGDTLSSIARRACTTVGTLQGENLMSTDSIRPGQVLALPSGHCLD